ncbi:hypothetical protein JRO89_XS11G0048600 [Xanthoceras sorbifolium]|uniref:Protein FAR1-RELATED SEQUENCE n=1 Tax=Xanthoceras sorbifolium TaxID=99658 RepID=A0ABQ8HET5_9ROSI|nr:hypothetical protein JRO89_XS11G0048600 [Xanthoceras sorbifolium]
MKTALPMKGLRWANVAITDIVVETTNHEQNLREPHSDDVHAFYNIYAKEAGFSVRLGSSKKIAFLPSHYILKRWTKTAKCDVVVDDKGSEEASKILEDDLNNVLSKVKSVVRSDSISKRHSSTPQIYNEPLAVRAKGCGKRLKGGKEKAKGKTTDNSRRCNGYRKVNHEDFNEAAEIVGTLDRLTLSHDVYPNLRIAINKIYKDGGVGAFYAVFTGCGGRDGLEAGVSEMEEMQNL